MIGIIWFTINLKKFLLTTGAILPEIVPNNVIEQYTLSPGDSFIACSDGLSDWITPEQMFDKIGQQEINTAVDELITSARVMALNKHNYFDDITALTVIVRE
jgi:serine/threonine protein phosphatase PrpC